MSSRITLGLMVGLNFLAVSCCNGGEAAEVTAALAQFKPGASPEEQLAALRSISTSLDQRIPAACLPLLRSNGTSVQRNAARAIGSRWWQIPASELTAYVQALKGNLGSQDAQCVNMARRGIGLVSRNYDNEMFSRSRNQRWVIYERYGKPCLIDTQNQTEELLGSNVEGRFLPAIGNQPLTKSCHWHPKQDMVALDCLVFRRPRLLWVWRASGGLRTFGSEELQKVLKAANGQLLGSAYDADFKEWNGPDLEFTVECISGEGDRVIEHTALLRWESGPNELRVLSDGRKR